MGNGCGWNTWAQCIGSLHILLAAWILLTTFFCQPDLFCSWTRIWNQFKWPLHMKGDKLCPSWVSQTVSRELISSRLTWTHHLGNIQVEFQLVFCIAVVVCLGQQDSALFATFGTSLKSCSSDVAPTALVYITRLNDETICDALKIQVYSTLDGKGLCSNQTRFV